MFNNRTQHTHPELSMYTTVNEEGLLNNYATEPQMYYAQYPSPEQQRRYAQLGGLAVLLVSALILTAVSVSAIV